MKTLCRWGGLARASGSPPTSPGQCRTASVGEGTVDRDRCGLVSIHATTPCRGTAGRARLLWKPGNGKEQQDLVADEAGAKRVRSTRFAPVSRAHTAGRGPRHPAGHADPAPPEVVRRGDRDTARWPVTFPGTSPLMPAFHAVGCATPGGALTRWCVARGEGAARCAGRRCGPGGAARHAASPVRAAPDRRPADPRPRAVPVR